MLTRPLTALVPAQPQLTAGPAARSQNAELTTAIRMQRARLWRYVRSRAGNDADAEDILQEVFGELVEAYRALLPIERLGAWLLRVARNRLIDRFRARSRNAGPPARRGATNPDAAAEGFEADWAALLPDHGGGPEAAYARSLLLEELTAAIEQLPRAQREVFIAHELAGESFAQMAARSGVGVNTLLTRKHYAVQFLRRWRCGTR